MKFIEIYYEARKRDLSKENYLINGHNYEFDYGRHSTGHDLNIYAKSRDSSKLLVYSDTVWFSSQYEFNNRGRILGFQYSGPWETHLNVIFDELEESIKTYDQQQSQDEEAKRVAEEARKEILINKFRTEFTT